MLRPLRLPQQEPLPEASRRCRRRSALRLRRRRDVVDRGRCLTIERLGGKAALAGRGRRRVHGHVAQRERGHHGAPKSSGEERHVQDASQSTSTYLFVAQGRACCTALLLRIRLPRRLRAHPATRGLLLLRVHGAPALLILPRRQRRLRSAVVPCGD